MKTFFLGLRNSQCISFIQLLFTISIQFLWYAWAMQLQCGDQAKIQTYFSLKTEFTCDQMFRKPFPLYMIFALTWIRDLHVGIPFTISIYTILQHFTLSARISVIRKSDNPLIHKVVPFSSRCSFQHQVCQVLDVTTVKDNYLNYRILSALLKCLSERIQVTRRI